MSKYTVNKQFTSENNIDYPIMIALTWYENSFDKIKLSESSLTVDFMASL